MAEKEDVDGGGGASGKPQAEPMSEDDRSPDGVEDSVTLSFLDKLKCMMYSKVERDAFLIEKLEKEEKKKAKKESEEDKGTKEKKKKPNLLDKLKSAFSSKEEQHEFLQRQVEEVAEEQKKKNQSADEVPSGADASSQ